jgi:hypothetical protein
MNNFAKITVALAAVVSCAAFAESGSDADQARRDRNTNEVLMKHHVKLDESNAQRVPEHDSNVKSSAHHAAEETRAETHKAAESTRNYTHKHLEQMRAFSARQDAAFEAKHHHPAAKMSAGEAAKS